MRDYQHSKFSLIWVKENKLTEGGGFRRPPKVENVLNRPGEIGLKDMDLKFGMLKQLLIVFSKLSRNLCKLAK